MAQPTRIIVLQRPERPLESVCARLRDWGGELSECVSYEQAVAALAAEGADIVLIDAWIEDGLPLLTQMKANAATRFLPIVIGTAEDAGAVAAHALALGADDVFVLPIADAELRARAGALARLAGMEIERRRRDALLAQFGVTLPSDAPGVPAIDRIGILLIGPAGGDQVQVMTALGGAATAAYAETSDAAIERLRRDDLDVALVTSGHDHHDLQRLCAAIRNDPASRAYRDELAKAVFDFSRTASQAGKYESAIDELREAERRFPEDQRFRRESVRVHLDWARKLQTDGELYKARNVLRRAQLGRLHAAVVKGCGGVRDARHEKSQKGKRPTLHDAFTEQGKDEGNRPRRLDVSERRRSAAGRHVFDGAVDALRVEHHERRQNQAGGQPITQVRRKAPGQERRPGEGRRAPDPKNPDGAHIRTATGQ